MNLINPIKTVCIIDDDKIYMFGLKKFISLKQPQPHLIEFENGKDAFDFISNPNNADHLPDIIFLDINMPVMDGWGFMENFVKIKSQLSKNITIYMVSSSIDPGDLNRAQNISEIARYVVKPITKDKFFELFELAA